MWRKPPGLPRTESSVLRTASDRAAAMDRGPQEQRLSTVTYSHHSTLLRATLCILLVASLGLASDPLTIPLGLDLYLPVPEDNPITAEKVALGSRLFRDKRLSRDKTVACATCHDPKRYFSDDKPLAEGVFSRRGDRRTPTIVNRAYGKAFFWDGRIATLEEQVVQPIKAETEMDMTLQQATARVREDDSYRLEFQNVFARAVNQDDLARALAAYVRTIVSGDSPYDRHVNGNHTALSGLEKQGLEVFRGKGNCTDCHLGPNLTDEKFHNTGVAWRNGRLLDQGRYLVSKNEKDRGAFKTPTLRNVADRAPYMHDGSLATLEEVVEYLDGGGNRNPYLDPELRPLKLTTEEKRALVAFLHTLTGTVREGIGTHR